MATQEQRSEATRTKLVAVGRKLFGAKGYDGTSVEELAQRAGVTRGALYHHFADKKALFRAVFERLEGDLMKAMAACSAGDAARSSRERFTAGCRVFFKECMNPEYQRIAILDAPAVLDWETLREIDARYSLSMIQRSLESAMAKGQMRQRPVEALAQLLLGALCEGGTMIARADNPQKVLAEVTRGIEELLSALLSYETESSGTEGSPS